MKNFLFGIVLLTGILFVISINAEEVKTDIVISRAVICKDIQNREPVDVGISFAADAEKIYFFTEIKSTESGQIKHIWYYKNEKVSETTLDYRPPRFRTWSTLQIKPVQKGEWNVEVVYDTTVLNRLVFKIE